MMNDHERRQESYLLANICLQIDLSIDPLVSPVKEDETHLAINRAL